MRSRYQISSVTFCVGNPVESTQRRLLGVDSTIEFHFLLTTAVQGRIHPWLVPQRSLSNRTTQSFHHAVVSTIGNGVLHGQWSRLTRLTTRAHCVRLPTYYSSCPWQQMTQIGTRKNKNEKHTRRNVRRRSKKSKKPVRRTREFDWFDPLLLATSSYWLAGVVELKQYSGSCHLKSKLLYKGRT